MRFYLKDVNVYGSVHTKKVIVETATKRFFGTRAAFNFDDPNQPVVELIGHYLTNKRTMLSEMINS